MACVAAVTATFTVTCRRAARAFTETCSLPNSHRRSRRQIHSQRSASDRRRGGGLTGATRSLALVCRGLAEPVEGLNGNRTVADMTVPSALDVAPAVAEATCGEDFSVLGCLRNHAKGVTKPAPKQLQDVFT
eukprot:scaffold647850_cov46-Prasinocladus_malaysianus.AAC.1